MPTVLMVMICLRCTLGGAEKRYARLFERLVAQPDSQHKLLINRAMLCLLQAAGILTHCDDHLMVLDPPSARMIWLARRRSIAAPVDAIWYVGQCWWAIRMARPQTVHPLLTAAYLTLPGLVVNPQVRRVMSAYSYQFESYRDRRLFGMSISAAIKRWAMQRAAVVEALSDSIRCDLIMRGIDAQRIMVAPGSFTDLSMCRPAVYKRKWVTFVGRFVEIKNPLLLAQALPALVAHHPDVRIFFIGEGPLEEPLRQAIIEAGLSASVTIQFHPQPTEILNESSIFVSLQREENYPSQSLLEAMACGNAVVATDVGETWRLVDKTTGIRVQPTAVAVAAAIIALLDDPALAQRQQAARARILAEHSAERFFAHMASVYQMALQVKTTYRTAVV